MNKKTYQAPTIDKLGSVSNLTKGEGWSGDGDQWWCFSWGVIEPTVS